MVFLGFTWLVARTHHSQVTPPFPCLRRRSQRNECLWTSLDHLLITDDARITSFFGQLGWEAALASCFFHSRNELSQLDEGRETGRVLKENDLFRSTHSKGLIIALPSSSEALQPSKRGCLSAARRYTRRGQCQKHCRRAFRKQATLHP